MRALVLLIWRLFGARPLFWISRYVDIPIFGRTSTARRFWLMRVLTFERLK